MEGHLYNVTLHTSVGENYLGDMSEMHLYGYVRSRTGSAAVAERVIEELDEKGLRRSFLSKHSASQSGLRFDCRPLRQIPRFRNGTQVLIGNSRLIRFVC
jgi:hypothetical protein